MWWHMLVPGNVFVQSELCALMGVVTDRRVNVFVIREHDGLVSKLDLGRLEWLELTPHLIKFGPPSSHLRGRVSDSADCAALVVAWEYRSWPGTHLLLANLMEKDFLLVLGEFFKEFRIHKHLCARTCTCVA